MDLLFRREFLKLASTGAAGATVMAMTTPGAHGQAAAMPGAGTKIVFDVRQYGAIGDGQTVDTPAINRAIEAANAAGGGTVWFPAGTYGCYSIHLKSNVVLHLDQGATILALEPGATKDRQYDEPEPNQPWDAYQDYGHNHWHNSLIWGEDIQNFGITGTGLIWGRGLVRSGKNGDPAGRGNKSIALKNCRNVVLRDFSILKGGWFGVLATGVDNMTIDNLKIDTNRDGMDIDCCRNVRVSNCTVNSPWDDGICPKSSFALGYARATENVTITNCYVCAFQDGTMLDGTFKRWPADAKIRQPTGRIKCGTESNGGFKNITISNCVFEACRGFALESVDGALLEDVTFTGVTMRDCQNTPFFLRLGRRMRGPEGTPVGTLKRIILSNVVSHNSQSELGGAGMIWGLPDHPIEDVKINDLYMEYVGGGTQEMAAMVPEEKEKQYPEPYQMGAVPASGFYVRNVKNIEFTNVELVCTSPDARPAVALHNVDGVEFFRLKTPRGDTGKRFSFLNVKDFQVNMSRGVQDTHAESLDHKQL